MKIRSGTARQAAMNSVVAAACCAGLIGCSDAPRVALLSDAPAFEGWLRIEVAVGERQRALEGSVRFDRPAGLLRFARQVDGVEVVLERVADGGLRKTRGGEPSAVELADEGDFALLLSVLQGQPEPQAEVRAMEDGYTIGGSGGEEIRVRYRAGSQH